MLASPVYSEGAADYREQVRQIELNFKKRTIPLWKARKQLAELLDEARVVLPESEASALHQLMDSTIEKMAELNAARYLASRV